MWCPSVSLSVWANAWLAGRAAPDDVLDALSAWAPCHSVLAYDAVAAGRTGLPWPDVDAAGPMSLLQTVRMVTGRSSDREWPQRSSISLVLPVPGDVRGLPAGSQFASDALETGEAVVVSAADGAAVGLVPVFECDDADDADDVTSDLIVPEKLSWSVYSLPEAPVGDHFDLGQAEYALRSAVRSATEALDGLQLSATTEDPRALVEELLEANSHHKIPDHAPQRALRVLSTAAHIDAIVTVGSGVNPIAAHSVSQAMIADSAIRPLASVVRSARMAAVNAILHSAWQP